ncbi:phage tail tube protein [Sphingomonas hengshuiensis]|uniref:Uncharacterized protein n=1 Tax=Sphingomonas hengshuiensis TaxID=1609977 RepID=A0A7U4LFL2_9SPHN|nr:phage tail tube protein [Sphingomonas hengshuiensis]AJP72269.1 hypothetical protein TS85_11425 [Sphingomonas hengshuiensis]
MGRALGANALLRAKFESTYGTPPGSNWAQLPFVSGTIGEEGELIESNLVGQGRDPFDPTAGALNNTGDVVVPADVRNTGYWLKLLFGAPTTSNYAAATGSITFSAQPAVDSTITINGTAFTYKASGATGNQINIGANVAATVTATATALNASVVSGVATATYAADGTNTSKLNVVYDTLGLAGNAFTLAASAGSNGTVSAATLTRGTVRHVFASGAASLPSMSAEVVHPELANPYFVHYGIAGNTLRIAQSRTGLLNMTLGLIAQGEADGAAASVAGTPSVLATDRFAQAVGEISLDGSVLGNVVSAEFSFSNNLNAVEVIRSDRRIAGVDPGTASAGGSMTMLFQDQTLLDAATAGTPVSVTRSWARDQHSLSIVTPRLFLPKFKRQIQGPRGIQVSPNVQASKPSGAAMVTATLINDVASY